jgi:hypothetical protein
MILATKNLNLTACWQTLVSILSLSNYPIVALMDLIALTVLNCTSINSFVATILSTIRSRIYCRINFSIFAILPLNFIKTPKIKQKHY